MRISLFLLSFVLLLVGCSAPAEPEPAPEPESHPIVGAWKVVSMIDVTGEEPQTVDNPPSLFLFTDSHYSVTYVPGIGERALFGEGQWPMGEYEPTAEEQAAAFNRFISNAGTYTIDSTTLTMDPDVAKHPNFMAHGTNIWEFSIEGDTLNLTSHDADAGAPTTEVELRRVE